MKTINLDGTGARTEVTAATSTAVPYPASVPAGAVALLVMFVNSSTLITSLGGAWTDWERRSRLGSTAIPSVYIVAKYPTDGTEGGTSVTVTHPNAVSISHIEIWTGVDTATPLDVAIGENDNTAGVNATAPTITPVTAGAALVHISSNAGNALTSSPPTAPGTFIEILDGTGTRSGAASYLLNQPASATGAVTATWSAANPGVAFLVALRPAPDGPVLNIRRRYVVPITFRRDRGTNPILLPAATAAPPQVVRRRLTAALVSRRDVGRQIIPNPPVTLAVWTPQTVRRDLASPTVRRRSRNTQPVPAPVAAAPAVAPPQAVRRKLAPTLVSRRDRGATPIPLAAATAAPAQLLRRRTSAVVPPRRSWNAQPVPAPVIAQAPAWAPQQVRRRLAAVLTRHPRGAQYVPDPVIATAPIWTPQAVRRRVTTFLAPKRARGAQYVPDPVVATMPTWTPQAVRRRLAPTALIRRARRALLPLPPQAATTLIPSNIRRRITTAPVSRRDRGAQSVPLTVQLAPYFLPQASRRRRAATWQPKRGHVAQYIATITAPTTTPGDMRYGNRTSTRMGENDATAATMRPGAATTLGMHQAERTATTMRPVSTTTATMRRP